MTNSKPIRRITVPIAIMWASMLLTHWIGLDEFTRGALATAVAYCAWLTLATMDGTITWWEDGS